MRVERSSLEAPRDAPRRGSPRDSSPLCKRRAEQTWLDTYFEARVYYADDDLVVAITDGTRSHYVTCLHEHFDGRQPLHGRHPRRSVSVAQRRLRYREDRRLKEQGRVIINLKVIHDG